MVDDAVLEQEHNHARPVARVCGDVGSGHGGDLRDRSLAAAQLPFLNGLACERLTCRCRLAPGVVFDTSLARICSSLNAMLKSKLKSLSADEAQKRHPIRRLYACSFASGARDTAESVTS